MDEKIIYEICKYIVLHINEEINIDNLAKMINYNKFYLIRKFKAYTGFTINEFINECRIYNSTNSLIFTEDTILKIALDNGFNSLEYYSEKFKEIIGLSPLRFRKIFTSLLYIAENTDNLNELNYIKAQIENLKAYQDYLNSFGMLAEEKLDKPKIKVFARFKEEKIKKNA